MKSTVGAVVWHSAMLFGITALIVLCIVYPFLPGKYDGLAVAISTMAQTFGIFGLPLVPVGVGWLVYEVKKRARRKQNHLVQSRGYCFGLAFAIAATFVALVVSLVAYATAGLSFGALSLALWLAIVFRLLPKLWALKKAESEAFNPMPLYLLFVPTAVLLCQLTLAAPVTEFSRNHAIAQSAQLIHDIEEYRTHNGRYPISLSAVYADYFPSVAGIEKYHYAPSGDAYNLYFEQPRFLLDNFGTREFVVYNPLDEQTMISHTGWILVLSPEELRANQGWYAVYDASSVHWKCFWFD